MNRFSRDQKRCRTCGGSGMLRLGDQRYRTCLDCLGQGLNPGLSPGRSPASSAADLLQGSLPRAFSGAGTSSVSR
ncbi:MAG: hypothetical protein ACKO7Z_05100 [Cyanobacteriota bacterium]